MYADYRFATIDGASVKDMINDQDWNANVFLPTVGKRGAAIIEARGLSSALRPPTPPSTTCATGRWAPTASGSPWACRAMANTASQGRDVRLPVTCEGGEYKIVEGLPIDAFSQECINKTLAELQGEQDGVKHLL
jgi:malate dehydrogenase